MSAHFSNLLRSLWVEAQPGGVSEWGFPPQVQGIDLRLAARGRRYFWFQDLGLYCYVGDCLL